MSTKDTRKLWNFVNRKLNRNNKKKSNIISHIIEDNCKITEPKELANCFNRYFCSVGKKVVNNNAQPNLRYTIPNIKRNNKSIFLNPTSEIEIYNIIKYLKDKAGGVDGIHTIVLKKMCHHIIRPLAYLINLSLAKGIFPDHLKIAEVIPIFKSQKKHLMNNYRPIALTSNIAKIYEKVIHKRLIDFLTKCNIISSNQFCFIRNLGTTDALTKTVDFIYKNLGKSKPTAAIFLDLTKAFDTVNHKILIDKLDCYGIRGLALQLIKSYLINRKQFVRANGANSSFSNLTMGVPQGTILGPFYFILYINDMLEQVPDILAYANDSVILCTGNTWEETQLKLQKNLSIVYNWLFMNGLCLNISKTSYMIFVNTNRTLPTNFEIKLNSIKLNRVNSVRYLGIVLDYKLR